MVDFNFFLIGSSCCVSAIRLEGVTDDCCVSFSLGLFVDAGGSGFFVDEVVDDDLLKKLEMDPLSWSTGTTKSDELLVVGPTASVTW